MDLRKSIEKAKKLRSQTQQPTEHAQDDGWISPAYTESRSVAVNPGRINQNRCITCNFLQTIYIGGNNRCSAGHCFSDRYGKGFEV